MADIKRGDTTVSVNSRVVDIGQPIWEWLEINGMLVLLSEDYDLPSDDTFKGRNVIAIDRKGNEIWKIEDFWYKIEDGDGRRIPDSYSHIEIGKDGKLYAFQPIGFLCEIDLKTGKILHEKQTR